MRSPFDSPLSGLYSPFRVLAGGVAALPPAFEAAGAFVEDEFQNSIPVAYPAGIASGQTLILHIMHRGTVTTPSGWTKEGESGAVSSSQKIAVFTKTADGAETGTLTVSQSGTGRMCGQMSSATGTVTTITTTTGESTTSVKPWPTGAVTSSGAGVAFAGMTRVGYAAGNTSVEAGWTLDTPVSVANLRLNTAHRDFESAYSEADGVTFDSTGGGATNYTWSVTVIE